MATMELEPMGYGDTKGGAAAYTHAVADVERDQDFQQGIESEKYDPQGDVRDMRRLGRKQEVKRRFRFFSIVGYMVILASTWEATLVTTIFSLPNGGTAGTIWMTFIGACGMFTSTLSLAEVCRCCSSFVKET